MPVPWFVGAALGEPKMQPDLPWNVAGIPPEAREAARAAARREGLSVGEWLTRRILRSLTDNSENAWSQAATGGRRPAPDDESMSAGRDAEEMFDRISRSESESVGAARKIEEQIRNLTRRLEATERSQAENNRAVSKAATEINIATREQTQAFDQLGAHVVGLGDRLARIERGASSDGVKDAVKGLHSGLSRLADQIAETANQSAGQIAALAGNIESVADKVNATRSESGTHTQALGERVAAFEELIRAVERAAMASAEKAESALAATESLRRKDESDAQRQTAALAQLADTLDKLASRLTTSEAQNAGALARLEDQIARTESRQGDSGFDRRLQGIEHALSDIMGRLENTERNAGGTARNVEENLINLSARVDAADKRHREALTELRNTLMAKSAQPEVAAVAAPVTQPAASTVPGTNFDLPPFPDTTPQHPFFQQGASDFASTAPSADLPPFADANPGFASDHPFTADSFAAASTQPSGASADSFIAAARRSARAASTAEAQHGIRSGLDGFTWGAAAPTPVHAEKTKSGSARFVLVAGIVVIAIGAIVAGILLSRGIVGNSTSSVQLPAQHARDSAAPPQPAPRVQDVSPDNTDAATSTVRIAPAVPGSPVIPLRHKPHSSSTPVEVKTAPSAQAASQSAPQPATSVAPAKPAPVSILDRLTTLANAGSAKAQLLMGLKYLDGDGVAVNEAEAAKWLERAANQNEAIAAYRLGTLFERGHGVPADTAKAMQWYSAAAKLGNRKAMHNMAVAYAEGAGAPKDLTQAAQWFSKAAALGLADSEFNLAVLYERGMGVQQSLIDAYKWYAIAAAQGDSESRARLDVISTQLSSDERAAAQRAAADFHPAPMDRNANVPPDPSALN